MPHNTKATNNLIHTTKSIAIVSVGFSVLFASLIGIYQAWKLQTPEVISQQWTAIALAFVSFFGLLIASLRKNATAGYYYGINVAQIVTYLAFITFIIYSQRGMASTAIILYTIPILIAAVTRATAAVFITAGLSLTTYCLAALKYFRDFPSEGYKVELYGQLYFYSILLLVIASLIVLLLINKRHQR